MSNSESLENLHTYLNDHLSGAVSAMELLDNLVAHHQQDRFGEFFSNLRNDVGQDVETLRDLMRKIGAEESSVRKIGAWLLEKFGRAKIGGGENDYGLLQALEALVLGITGKKLLWRSLDAIAPTIVELQATDFGRLQQRAQEQIDRVETERISVARVALSDREQT